MAAKVPKSYGGGAGIVEPGGSGDSLATVLRQISDDLAALKVAYNDLATKYSQHLVDGKHRVATAVDAAAPLPTTTAVVIGISKA